MRPLLGISSREEVTMLTILAQRMKKKRRLSWLWDNLNIPHREEKCRKKALEAHYLIGDGMGNGCMPGLKNFRVANISPDWRDEGITLVWREKDGTTCDRGDRRVR